ncbi:Asp23/Gls24 family envelope stress response protein [Streptosporangium sp. NPDC051023]|uniref:Asp23/Gls24 family envelope stress response protein n=1 Tax=Streptosporangium sp. NPDC051023 TaxID=3155410 RepID=UPI00344E86CB
MTTPVEHHPTSAETSAGVPGLPTQRAGSVSPSGTAPASWPSGTAPPVRTAVPAELRGRTDIPARVVSRIAARAAGEVARVREVRERGPLTFGGHTHATVDGGLALLELEVSVEYPAPLLRMAEEIRRHVGERVRALTGLTVGQIDIDVTGAVPASQEDDTHTTGAAPSSQAGDTDIPGAVPASQEDEG